MSTHWNYRVIEFVDPTEGPWRAIHEVYYDEHDRPCAYTEGPAVVISDDTDSVQELANVLDMMRAALGRPVLVGRDFQREPTQ